MLLLNFISDAPEVEESDDQEEDTGNEVDEEGRQDKDPLEVDVGVSDIADTSDWVSVDGIEDND